MDQEYENKLKRCDIRKGHIVQVIVKETSSNFPQGGGCSLENNRQRLRFYACCDKGYLRGFA